MLQSFLIDRCREEDCPAIAAIESLCFSHPWSTEGIRSTLMQDNTVFLVARHSDRFAGYISFQYVLDEGYINNIAVDPNLRRSGIGKKLLEEAVAQGKQLHLAFLTLEVRPSNTAAVHLYTSMGFCEEGRRKNFYADPAEDALLLTYRYTNE